MYTPNHFAQSDLSEMHAFVQEIAFASLIQARPDGDLWVNHLPFLLQVQGDVATLQTHVARNNPLWRDAEGTNATVVFQGPHAYISPRAYEEKPRSGKVVPTWNYAAVHARGRIALQHSQVWLIDFLERLTQLNEAQFGEAAWSIHDAPADYLASLSKAIVGIEIRVEHWQGKWKLSQNRSDADRAAIIETLKAPRPVSPWQYQNELAVAELMS